MTKKTKETPIIGVMLRNRLLRRLQKHITEKNCALNQALSQQDWIAKAIAEKLKRESELAEPEKNSLKNVYVCVPLQKKLVEQLSKRLAELKLSRKNDPQKCYSKTSWLIEAIEEKLEQEEGIK